MHYMDQFLGSRQEGKTTRANAALLVANAASFPVWAPAFGQG